MMTGGQQQDLFGEPDPPPKLTDRIFFAIMPDDAAISAIHALTADLKARHGMRGRPTAEQKLHVTLCNLGDYPGMPDAVLKRASQAAASVAAAGAPFNVCFDVAQTFVNRARNRPFVLTGGDGVIGVSELYKNLAQALLKAGLPRNPPSYTPHITLLYDDVTVAPASVTPVEWMGRELVLLHSRIGQNLPYETLARWSL
jgi:2'-5' RNA ligase